MQFQQMSLRLLCDARQPRLLSRRWLSAFKQEVNIAADQKKKKTCRHILIAVAR